jgi:hypothetical protein
MAKITLIMVPGDVLDVTVAEGASVADVLKKGQLEVDGQDVQLNGNDTDLDAPVEDGDAISVADDAKGNAEQVAIKVSKVPGDGTTVMLPLAGVKDGAFTVEDVAKLAEVRAKDMEGMNVCVNNEDSKLSTIIKAGDEILFAFNAKGNN